MEQDVSCKNCIHAETCMFCNTIHEITMQNAMFFENEDHLKSAGIAMIDGLGKHCKFHPQNKKG